MLAWAAVRDIQIDPAHHVTVPRKGGYKILSVIMAVGQKAAITISAMAKLISWIRTPLPIFCPNATVRTVSKFRNTPTIVTQMKKAAVSEVV